VIWVNSQSGRQEVATRSRIISDLPQAADRILRRRARKTDAEGGEVTSAGDLEIFQDEYPLPSSAEDKWGQFELASSPVPRAT
jgi:2-isopropylmalate synthase